MRLFAAIELPDDVRATIGRFAEEARSALPERSVRWVAPANLHVTLLFLGDTDDARIPAVCAALDRASAEMAPITLEVTSSGRFSAAAWVGLEGALAPLTSYVAALHRELDLVADRPLRPHVTIGRFRDPRRSRRLALPSCGSLGTFDATEAVLFASELGPGGARYAALHRAPFAQSIHGARSTSS